MIFRFIHSISPVLLVFDLTTIYVLVALRQPYHPLSLLVSGGNSMRQERNRGSLDSVLQRETSPQSVSPAGTASTAGAGGIVATALTKTPGHPRHRPDRARTSPSFPLPEAEVFLGVSRMLCLPDMMPMPLSP